MADLDVGKQPPMILIVDDVEMNRFSLKNIISDMGYQAVLADRICRNRA